MTNNLFVAGLSNKTTSEALNQHFSQIGTVTSAQVINDRDTGESKGFGFVEMSTVEEAKLAMDKLNNTVLDERTIVVKEARPREDRNNRDSNKRY